MQLKENNKNKSWQNNKINCGQLELLDKKLKSKGLLDKKLKSHIQG